jgi:hypothetical protein
MRRRDEAAGQGQPRDGKIHCSVLAEDAIKAAIADYKAKQDKDKGVPVTAGHAQPNA